MSGMLTPKQAGAIIGRSAHTVRLYIRNGMLDGRELYPERRRPTYVTTEEACRRFLAGLTTEPTTPAIRYETLRPEAAANW